MMLQKSPQSPAIISRSESILEREFSGRFASFHGHHSDCVLDGENLTQFLNDASEITAVTSHHLPIGIDPGTRIFRSLCQLSWSPFGLRIRWRKPYPILE